LVNFERFVLRLESTVAKECVVHWRKCALLLFTTCPAILNTR